MDKVEFIEVRKGDVFDGVAWGAPAGQVTALLGPRGSGKTLALRMIAGLDRPDKGVVMVNGVDVGASRGSRLRKIQRGISTVLGAEPLHEKLSVREHLTAALKDSGHVPKARLEEETERMLYELGLSGVSRDKPDALLFADRRRLAIARALSLRAPLVLIDDIDADLGERDWTELCDAVRDETEHRTCIVATARPEVAERIADRTIQLGTAMRLP